MCTYVYTHIFIICVMHALLCFTIDKLLMHTHTYTYVVHKLSFSADGASVRQRRAPTVSAYMIVSLLHIIECRF